MAWNKQNNRIQWFVEWLSLPALSFSALLLNTIEPYFLYLSFIGLVSSSVSDFTDFSQVNKALKMLL